MLDSLFRKSLKLTLGDRTLRFESKGDFEFALSSRTEVPAHKVAALVRLDAKELLAEAARVRKVERRFMAVLSRSIQEGGSIGYLLRQMDMKLFSQDHEWRAIMQALAKQPARFDEYKQLALVKYTQYLASRQDVLKVIFNHKPTRHVEAAEPESGLEASVRQTVIFDFESLADNPAFAQGPPTATGVGAAEPIPARLTRLPRGEKVHLRMAAGDVEELVLSRHRFAIRAGTPPVLVDDRGDEHDLKAGRNVVGRHPESDIIVDAAYRDVSRTHLILEIDDDHGLHVTDLSSHGTYMPAELVAGAPD